MKHDVFEHLTQEEIQEHNAFVNQNYQELALPAMKSEGFMYVPAENIKIAPPKYNESGLIEIREPAKKIGVESFRKRDQLEKRFPRKI